MAKIEKLFKKINKKDRQRLLCIIELLLSGKTANLNISKIKNTDFFRLKSGNYRIISHKEHSKIIIDSIKLRNKRTYHNL